MPLPGVTAAIGRSPTKATPQFAMRAIATGVQTQPCHPVVGTRKTTTVVLTIAITITITIAHATLAETKSRAHRENIMKLRVKKPAVVLSDFERGILERFVASHQEEHGRYLEAVDTLAKSRAIQDQDAEPQIAVCAICGYDVDGDADYFNCLCDADDANADVR